MSIIGLELSKEASGYRIKRFTAFFIDAIIVLVTIYITFRITGKPDFPSVKVAMDAAKAGASGPDAQALANVMFTSFNAAYLQSLLVWFTYEVTCQLIFSGATIGKLIMKLRIVPTNNNRRPAVHHFLMIFRSALKIVFLYLFQGFPFLISQLTIFANKESRSGFDMFVKTHVIASKGGN